MPQAKSPDCIAGEDEDKANQRCEHPQDILRMPGQIIQWNLLKPSVGDGDGTKGQNGFPIDSQRILPKFLAAIRQDVHKFQPLQRKKAEGSI